MKLIGKLIIYTILIVILIPFSLASELLFEDVIFEWIVNIGIGIVHFWFLFVVYSDAKKRGVSENWWLAVFFLSVIGGFIYYFSVKDKPIMEHGQKQEEKVPFSLDE